jgi:hypothetical protein
LTKKRSECVAGRTSSKRLKEASPETLAYVNDLLSVFERALAMKRQSVLAESFGRGFRLVELSGGRKVRRKA